MPGSTCKIKDIYCYATLSRRHKTVAIFVGFLNAPGAIAFACLLVPVFIGHINIQVEPGKPGAEVSKGKKTLTKTEFAYRMCRG